MGSKIVIILLMVVATAIIGITYGSMMLNSQVPSSSTPTNCKPESLAGNFTSTPQMNATSSGPYYLTFYIQNLAAQSATIAEYTDNNGLAQPVNWTVPASMTGSFQTTLSQTEDSLTLQTSCGTLFTTHLYYPAPSGESQVNHYNVTLYVSLGGNAT